MSGRVVRDVPTAVSAGVQHVSIPLDAAGFAKLAGSGHALVSFETANDEVQAFDVPLEASSTTGTVGGTVPATLSLSLGPPAAFSPFIPGVKQDYFATDHGERRLHRRQRDPRGRRPEHHRDGPSGQRLVRAVAGAAGEGVEPGRVGLGLRAGRRVHQPDDAADVRGPGDQRSGRHRVQAVDRGERSPAHGELQQDADVHALDHQPIGNVARGPSLRGRRAKPGSVVRRRLRGGASPGGQRCAFCAARWAFCSSTLAFASA